MTLLQTLNFYKIDMAKNNVSQSEINSIYCGNQLCDMSGIIDCENKFFHFSNQIETSTFPEINKMYNFRKNKRFIQNNTKKNCNF